MWKLVEKPWKRYWNWQAEGTFEEWDYWENGLKNWSKKIKVEEI